MKTKLIQYFLEQYQFGKTTSKGREGVHNEDYIKGFDLNVLGGFKITRHVDLTLQCA